MYCTEQRTFTRRQNTFRCYIHVHTCTCIHTVDVHTFYTTYILYMCMYMYVHKNMNTAQIYMCMYMYMHMHTCTCTCIYNSSSPEGIGLFLGADELHYSKELLVALVSLLFLQDQHEVVVEATLHHDPVHRSGEMNVRR